MAIPIGISGIGSMTSVAGAGLFLVQLGQTLKIIGISTATQMIVEGVAIALGMTRSQVSMPRRWRLECR